MVHCMVRRGLWKTTTWTIELNRIRSWRERQSHCTPLDFTALWPSIYLDTLLSSLMRWGVSQFRWWPLLCLCAHNESRSVTSLKGKRCNTRGLRGPKELGLVLSVLMSTQRQGNEFPKFMRGDVVLQNFLKEKERCTAYWHGPSCWRANQSKQRVVTTRIQVINS